mmetsp:Transcript_21234/g.39631  ORF Transcript_21234/g.39631 Transcript_21234/m.39631 type:complete len:233 (-) Transcript_21234:865-1563(-)
MISFTYSATLNRLLAPAPRGLETAFDFSSLTVTFAVSSVDFDANADVGVDVKSDVDDNDDDVDGVPKLKPLCLPVEGVFAGALEPNTTLGFALSELDNAPKPNTPGAFVDIGGADDDEPDVVLAAPNTPGAVVDIGGAEDEPEPEPVSLVPLRVEPPNENDAFVFSSLSATSAETLDADDVKADVDVDDDVGGAPKLNPPCLPVEAVLVGALEPNPKLGFALSLLDDAPKPN